MKTVQVDDIGSLLVTLVKHNFKGLKAMRVLQSYYSYDGKYCGPHHSANFHTLNLKFKIKPLGIVLWVQSLPTHCI